MAPILPRKPELLAPAGNPEALAAAFAAGADAVYAGLPKFNARERGENFTVESMGSAIAEAHRLRRKVYLTFNTLVKESELPEVAEYLGAIAAMRPDALIVQDLGVLRLIREYFPTLVIHASTQMGLHNSAGLQLAGELGVKRVILERQVTLEELTALSAASPVELEVFIHGALCCSLSGSCLFSSWLGGASGNRGKCKQPCRRRYFTKNGNGFFFSPADLETLELIPRFRELGIASLKIEGRLRQSDYVYQAVSAYRMVLDAETVTRELLGEARKVLSASCGRRWSSGFYSAESAQNLIRHESPGASGVLLGQVAEVGDGGFTVTLNKRLHLGDRLRVQPKSGDEGPAFTLTKLFVERRGVRTGRPGETVYIPCDKPIPPGGLLYRTGVTMDFSAQTNFAPPKKTVQLALAFDQAGLGVTVRNADGVEPWRYDHVWARAEKRPPDPAAVRAAFSFGDSERFAPEVTELELPEDIFLPAGVLKQARRAFRDWLETHLACEQLHDPGASGMLRFARDYRKKTAAPIPEGYQRETVAIRPRGAEPGNPKAWKAVGILDFNRATDEVILPDFCPEGRLAGLKKRIRAAYDAGLRRFRITGLYALELLRGYDDLVIVTGYPLPVTNSLAVDELRRFGVSRVQASPELEREAIEALRDHAGLPLEVYRYGRPALLTTRAALPVEGEIRDNRGNTFSIRPDSRQKLTRLYAKAVFSVPRIPGTGDFYDLTQARWGEKESSDFNFTKGWQ